MKQKKNKNKKKIEKVSNVENERKPKKEEVEKNIDKEEGKASQKNRKIRKFLKIILAIGAGLFSVIEILPPIIELYHEIQISKPRFSLEKITNEDGSLTWKICNYGESISNATIYPVIYVTFMIYDEKHDKGIDIVFELLGYYNNYYYSSLDELFYIKDEKQSELNTFIEKYICILYAKGYKNVMYSTSMYFTLNYYDYKGKNFNKIYTISSDNFMFENSDRKIFGDNFEQLKEILKIPNSDIITPLKFEESCVISINYKNAVTQQVIDNEYNYENYLYAVILDLIDSKDKSINEMYGMIILSNGNLWVRDTNTGELIKIADNVKEFGFTK